MMQSERQDTCLKILNRFKRETWESGNKLRMTERVQCVCQQTWEYDLGRQAWHFVSNGGFKEIRR